MADISRRQLVTGAAGLAVVGSLAAACGGGSSPPGGGGGGGGGKPKRGGNFRLGVTGGGSKDIMDGQNIITKPDQARLVTAFETLLLFDDNYKLTTNGLAESVTADNPKQYTIKLKPGIEFSNGKTLTADDVLYSFQRIGTKGNGLTGYAATATMDIAGMKKLDKYTVRLPLKTPDATVPQTLASYTFNMVPVDIRPTLPSRSAQAPTYSSRSRQASRACMCGTRTTGAAASRTLSRSRSSTSTTRPRRSTGCSAVRSTP